MPLRLLRHRNLTGAAVGMLWTAAMFACFFITTLYLQLVLHYSPLQTGLLLAAAGLALLGQAPAGGHFLTDVLPGSVLLGTGAGTALAPLLVMAVSDVRDSESGLASGVVNTSFMLGGALGLAVLAGLATTRTSRLMATGSGHAAALVDGYHAAFLAAAACAAIAGLLAARWLRTTPGARRTAPDGAPAADPLLADA